MKWILIFVIGITWNARVGGPNAFPEMVPIRLHGEMKQTFDSAEKCDKALKAVFQLLNNRGNALYIQGAGRCEKKD